MKKLEEKIIETGKMGEQFDRYDFLRYELFELLIPKLLYKEAQEQNEEFFNLLLNKGKDFLHEIYNTLCEDDNLPYPYEKQDFEVRILKRKGVKLLQILLPSYNSAINDILRVYILFMENKDGRVCKKYFVIKRFANGNIFNLHITPEDKKRLGEELTEHIGDLEFEYGKLISDYELEIALDMQEEEKKRKLRKKDKMEGENVSNSKKWSKDWGNFDWGEVEKKLRQAERDLSTSKDNREHYDIGISKEEFIEYLQWLNINGPEEYEKILLYMTLKLKNVEDEQIELLISNKEMLKKIIDIYEE